MSERRNFRAQSKSLRPAGNESVWALRNVALKMNREFVGANDHLLE
jgi:hypothetical protein